MKNKTQNLKPKKCFLSCGLCTSNIPSERGFTFVETLVAIAVLLVAVVAPLSLAYQSLSASRVARNQVTATYLAQEAIEFVRATRDTNILSGNDWLFGLSACVQTVEDSKCTIDASEEAVDVCQDGVCAPLRYDPETFIYSYDANDAVSPFTRSVVIVKTDTGPTAQNEARVEATVTWQDGANTRSVVIDELLFNWQQ